MALSRILDEAYEEPTLERVRAAIGPAQEILELLSPASTTGIASRSNSKVRHEVEIIANGSVFDSVRPYIEAGDLEEVQARLYDISSALTGPIYSAQKEIEDASYWDKDA